MSTHAAQSARPTDTSFESNQTDAIYPKGVEKHWWSAARNRIIARTVRGIAESQDAILEIGCGTGVVVDHLARAGFNIRGCDLSTADPATPEVAGRLALGVDAFELPEHERASVDAILLLDVLEHLPEPRAFVDRITQSFPNARWILVTLPARQELWSNYDEFNRHYKRYAIDDASEFLPAGVRVRTAAYFFHALWLPARLLTAMGRDRATRFTPPTGASVALHALLARVFDWESRLVPSRVPGSSLRFVLELER